MTAPRHVITPPKQPDAEPVCLLDKEWAERRQEEPGAFLDLARRTDIESGAEFRFVSAGGLWERVETFVAEERECCPFFAFEQWEEDGAVVLRITTPTEQSNG